MFTRPKIVIASSDRDEAIRFFGADSGLLRGACHRADHFGPDPLVRNDDIRADLESSRF
jgi:hypothetical protein